MTMMIFIRINDAIHFENMRRYRIKYFLRLLLIENVDFKNVLKKKEEEFSFDASEGRHMDRFNVLVHKNYEEKLEY